MQFWRSLLFSKGHALEQRTADKKHRRWPDGLTILKMFLQNNRLIMFGVTFWDPQEFGEQTSEQTNTKQIDLRPSNAFGWSSPKLFLLFCSFFCSAKDLNDTGLQWWNGAQSTVSSFHSERRQHVEGWLESRRTIAISMTAPHHKHNPSRQQQQ